jgi:hypothetical protein
MLHLRPVGVKGRGRRAQQKGKITTEEKSDIGVHLFIAHVVNVCDKGFTRSDNGSGHETRDDHDDRNRRTDHRTN